MRARLAGSPEGQDDPASNHAGSFAALTAAELRRLLRDPDHFKSARASFSPNDFFAFANTAVDCGERRMIVTAG